MSVLVTSKTKSYWIYQEIALFFIFLYQPLIPWLLQSQATGLELFVCMIMMEAFAMIKFFLWWIVMEWD